MEHFIASYAIRLEENDHALEVGCVKVSCDVPGDVPSATIKKVLDDQGRRLPREQYIAVTSWSPDPEMPSEDETSDSR